MNAPGYHRSRGLTLLEVLIATAILAMLAAACVPVIARAMALLRDDRQSTISIIDLAAVADAFIAKPESFGTAAVQIRLHEITRLEIAWPVNENAEGVAIPSPSRAPIIVRALPLADAAADHLWLAFTCESVTVCRWVSVPEEGVSTEGTNSKGGPS